jgi:hypothetical protein
MRTTLTFVFAAALAGSALAQSAAPAPAPPQIKLPRVSQHAVVTQTVGLTDVTITYSRPGVKGRTLWGNLVPYDKVWRTGANEATEISFSDDVTINGQKLGKGTYSLHTVPNPDEWTIIFNSVADQWGSYSYDQTKDALRVKSKAQPAEFREWLTFDFPAVSNDAATVAIRWGGIAVPFTVGTNTTASVLSALRAATATAAADDWQTPYRAASFAFDSKMDSDAARWIEQSLKAKETLSNLWLRAQMYQRAGDKADAIRTAELALSKKGDKDSDILAGEIRKQIDGWKK